jgi:hypothetical protein
MVSHWAIKITPVARFKNNNTARPRSLRQRRRVYALNVSRVL